MQNDMQESTTTTNQDLPETGGTYLADSCRQRANYYRYLSRLFYEELTESLMEEMVNEQDIVALSESMNATEREFALGTNRMIKYLARRTPDTLTETRCDYARVFLGAGSTNENPVSPFESVYTSEEHLLMQEARDEIHRIFLEEHIVLDDEYNMPEDHISFEFQYMARLLDQLAQTLDHDDKNDCHRALECANDFFENHIANWVPRFCDDVMALAKTSFYSGLGQCTKAWISLDKQVAADICFSLDGGFIEEVA